jgi:hypothetical protein
MSARSSARRLVFSAIAIAACGKSHSAPPPPEADPAQVAALAKAMVQNAPAPGMLHDCTHAELDGALTMTHVTLLELAGNTIANDPEHAAWTNPPELDAAPARALLDGKSDVRAKRQAAAQWLAAPAYVVYRIDNVDAPLALSVKELKIGTIGARVIRYEKSGHPSCVSVFVFQNDQQVSAKAIEASDKTLVDPAVAEGLRKDLTAQLLAHAPR